MICETEAERPSTIVTRAESDRGPESSSGHVVTPETVSRARGMPLERLRRRLQGDLEQISLRALHKEPQHRYRSVQESRGHCTPPEDQPVKARPSTLQYRARKLIRRRKTEMLALVLLSVLAGGWAYSLWRQGWWPRMSVTQEVRANARPGVPAIHSLAVLPLRTFRGDLNQEYFADGMTEGLITELSGISALKVISRTSVMPFKKIEQVAA